ncbi:zincin-like metallopeptidase domain-containing protein [Glaciimonas sp. CA11.2]|uniref:ArdC family protein n=1 Tax=Glaciimonas sp. CA11.2 TaxID=3048601 RepID=UPI002AB59494|nr:zincin-like metallopeptidase domain-containing protein [Glaciimonas sp. CA11.2]MDY7546735.1 zincin-like metallopeptidase domain-containing protein [Glaciimonas sp. CA11.2]MEB0162890.1 zincin-like metallopeptidase domain-containing protein [Glaciimonas sp. CA11.2]
MTKQRIDLYQTVTNQIINALEAGTPPWVCPWSDGEVDPNPANLTTGRAYRGINVLLLNLQSIALGYARNRWLTFHQTQELGGHVRRGEHGTAIVFFKMHEVGEAPAAAPSLASGQADGDRRIVPLLRSFTVFNVDQVEGLPVNLQQVAITTPDWNAVDCAEQLLNRSGALIRHGGKRAFYHSADDFIQLPPKLNFFTAKDYYATALHELTHWTGHSSRCDRVLGKRQGIDAYAFEELVAEMGAAFLCNHCHMAGQLQHASYIASWLQALRGDRRLIFTAASQAQRAADYLLQPENLEPIPVLTLAEAA